jgi:hypothetical protein
MVARQLAKDGEEKLAAQRQLQEQYERVVNTQPHTLNYSGQKLADCQNLLHKASEICSVLQHAVYYLVRQLL